MSKSVSFAVLLVLGVSGAWCSPVDNSVYESRGIHTGDELVSTVLTNCLDMSCVKSNVLTYLNTLLNVNQETEARSTKDVDEEIFNRVGKLINTYEFRYQLPETFFQKSEITFNGERGFNVEASKEAVVEGKHPSVGSTRCNRITNPFDAFRPR